VNFIYILQSQKSGRYYIGSTKNLQQRLEFHNKNKVKATKSKGPWKIIYQETYQTAKEARQREYQIKSFKSGNSFKQLINSVN
jgi:putative endonuclease